MVKYIFLDFDGVLNTEQYQAELALERKPAYDEYGPLFYPRAITNLGILLETTGANIVITSSWRNIHSTNELNKMWVRRNMPGKIHSVITSRMEKRGLEIAEFLSHNTNYKYVILDDVDEFLPIQQDHFVRVNPIVGITKANVERAIALLNEKSNSNKQ